MSNLAVYAAAAILFGVGASAVWLSIVVVAVAAAVAVKCVALTEKRHPAAARS